MAHLGRFEVPPGVEKKKAKTYKWLHSALTLACVSLLVSGTLFYFRYSVQFIQANTNQHEQPR